MYRLASVLIEWPYLAFVAAIGFLLLAIPLRRKRAGAQRLVLLTAAVWAAYGVYESLMKLRILCTGECNIRIDLLVIYPVLFLLSLIVLGVGLWRLNRAP